MEMVAAGAVGVVVSGDDFSLSLLLSTTVTDSSVKNPVTSPLAHSCLNPILSQNSAIPTECKTFSANFRCAASSSASCDFLVFPSFLPSLSPRSDPDPDPDPDPGPGPDSDPSFDTSFPTCLFSAVVEEMGGRGCSETSSWRKRVLGSSGKDGMSVASDTLVPKPEPEPEPEPEGDGMRGDVNGGVYVQSTPSGKGLPAPRSVFASCSSYPGKMKPNFMFCFFNFNFNPVDPAGPGPGEEDAQELTTSS